MTNAVSLIRSLLIYGLCLPLAIFLGYLLATPLDFTTFATVGLVLLLLMVPILLNWHRPLLIAFWSTSVVVPFLPGSPPVWLTMAGISLLITVLQRTLNKDLKLLNVPSLTWPLVFLALVILVTAKLTGGIGFGAAGGSTGGGKRYILMLGGILGYFALSSQPIPRKRAGLFVCLFFLGALTAAVGNLAPLVNPSFYFLFSIFPVEKAGLEAIGNEIVVASALAQFSGLTLACSGIVYSMLALYGIRGLIDLRYVWRLLLLMGVVVVGFFGGFRSIFVTYVLVFISQFYFERLYRTRLLPVMVLVGILTVSLLLPVVDRLPLSIQRTLSVLPVQVDPAVRFSADASSEWRVTMWKVLLPDIPKYLLLGKGFGLNAREMELLSDLQKSGRASSMEVALLASDYHNGPLTVIIPFGIFGALGFVWFLVASMRVLYRNYRYGDAALRNLNTFLLAFFVARVTFFFFVYGAFHTELYIFTGIIGLSVSLNGGVARPEPVSEAETNVGQLEPAKAGFASG